MQKYREKAMELLGKMSLTEKIGQLILYAGCNVDDKGVPDNPEFVEHIRMGRVGTVIVQPQDLSVLVDTLQKIAVEESRLHIPLLINVDMIHGYETVFPIPLACACSFDPELVEACTKTSAKEAVACGVRYTNAPMVDIARDPRWGRIAESPGEDTFLACEMAKAYVRGYQNDEAYVMATMKHYAGYGACEGGRDYDMVEINENTMLNTYLPPFYAGIQQGAGSVMTGFNVLNNVPISGNHRYLREILRGKFGFDGIVISDACSINEMLIYGICKDLEECCEKAMCAGVDIDLGGISYSNALENAVRSGQVREELVDEAVVRVLEKKFALGIFEQPYSRADKSCVFSTEHLDTAERLATECAVLLKNNGVLPLAKEKKIAIVGKYANCKDVLGCWQNSSRTEEVSTLKDVFLKEGYSVVGICEDYDIQSVEKAVEGADVVLFTCGEYSEQSGEARSRQSLRLTKEEIDCFDFLKNKTENVVSLVFGGRPLIIGGLDVGAVVCCWDLGHRTAEAIEKLLSGKCNFSGKLAVTFPANEGQIPIYYAKKRLGRPYEKDRPDWRFQARYGDGENEPAYPFGFGLSYSRFAYKNLRIDKNEMHEGGMVKVSVDLENTSDRDGVEIVQMYVGDLVAEVARPPKELKGFQRVFVKAKECVTVEFTITEKELSYYHIDGSLKADAGEFVVFVGGDSNCEDKVGFCYKIDGIE